MYAAIRHYHTPGIPVAEIAEKVHREFLPVIAKLPGFVDYHFVDGGENASISISVFLTKEAEAESNRLAKEWVAKTYGDRVQRVAMYEGPIVAFQRGPEVVV